MQITFDNEQEYDSMWGAVHDAILYWKKVRQATQGKICLHPDGSDTHYSEEYAVGMIVQYAKMLKSLEDSQGAEYYSVIITQALKLDTAEVAA